MVYTSVGRYLKFGNLVSFDLSVNVANRSTCQSDLDIDLPPFPSSYVINAVGTSQLTGNTSWTKYASLTGWAAPNAAKLRVYLSGRGISDNTGLCQTYTTGAFDIYISGQYECIPSDISTEIKQPGANVIFTLGRSVLGGPDVL
jgi:hypothetical protein